MSALTVEVTQADINAGKCADPHTCALALAFARALGRGVGYVSVGAFVAHDNMTNKDYSLSGKLDPYATPTEDSPYRFIDKFDAGARVKPTTFTLWETTEDDVS